MALSAALDAIWASQIPLTEKRRLAARAVAMQMASGQGSDHVGGCSGECQALEDVLAEVAVFRGPLCGKTSVSEAKAVLRQLGSAGTSLASRLGRLSKRRNAAAHPDSGLLHDVRALAAEHQGTVCFFIGEAVDGSEEQLSEGEERVEILPGESPQAATLGLRQTGLCSPGRKRVPGAMPTLPRFPIPAEASVDTAGRATGQHGEAAILVDVLTAQHAVLAPLASDIVGKLIGADSAERVTTEEYLARFDTIAGDSAFLAAALASVSASASLSFELLDGDRDGALSRLECDAGLEALGFSHGMDGKGGFFVPIRPCFLLPLLDGDGDGHITRDEFCDGFSILDAGRDDYGYVDLFAAFDLDSDGQSSRQQWHLTFDVVDTNHDGLLSAEEFYAVACTDGDD